MLLPLPLSPRLGTLADGLGCLPLDYEAYPPQSHSQAAVNGIHGLVGVDGILSHLVHPEPYLH